MSPAANRALFGPQLMRGNERSLFSAIEEGNCTEVLNLLDSGTVDPEIRGQVSALLYQHFCISTSVARNCGVGGY